MAPITPAEELTRAQKQMQNAQKRIARIRSAQERKAQHLKIVLGGIIVAITRENENNGIAIVNTLLDYAKSYKIKVENQFSEKFSEYMKTELEIRKAKMK